MCPFVLYRYRIFEFEIVPLPRPAGEHRFAIKNAAIGGVSRNNAPVLLAPAISHPISGIHTPSLEMIGGRTPNGSGV